MVRGCEGCVPSVLMWVSVLWCAAQSRVAASAGITVSFLVLFEAMAHADTLADRSQMAGREESAGTRSWPWRACPCRLPTPCHPDRGMTGPAHAQDAFETKSFPPGSCYCSCCGGDFLIFYIKKELFKNIISLLFFLNHLAAPTLKVSLARKMLSQSYLDTEITTRH